MYMIYKRFLKRKNYLWKELLFFFGINKYISTYYCNLLGMSKKIKVQEIPIDKFKNIKKVVELYIERRDYKKKRIISNIMFQRNIRSLRGLKHIIGLPVNGQRTKRNAKTRKKLKKKQEQKVENENTSESTDSIENINISNNDQSKKKINLSKESTIITKNVRSNKGKKNK